MGAVTGDSERRLPPGSHGIPEEVVARNQRERLVAAIAEECGERGFAETSVARIAKRAGVSSVTFYRQFEGKRECMLAAHRELSARLLEAVDGARGGEGDAGGGTTAPLRTLLAVFAADPPSARLLAVDVLAAGPEGVEGHAALAEALAVRLETDWVHAAGLLAVVGRRVVAGEADRLPALEVELAATLSSRS